MQSKGSKFLRLAALVLAIAMVLTMFSACGRPVEEKKEETAKPAETTKAEPEKPKEPILVTITVKNVDPGWKWPKDENGVYSTFYAKEIGVKYKPIDMPWEGGVAYTQALNTMLASGDLPDIVIPWNGFENTMIKEGQAINLKEALPKYAPNLWKKMPERIWKIMSTYSDDGGIYIIPAISTLAERSALIRKDWLDRVGMSVPQTKDEFVAVLKAFRDKDANGNGDPKDEIPVSGRELGRWMDNLFLMFGVAMWEGYPEWDVYDGKVQYAAITPNMKAALEFIGMLYKEKLLDNETFLNKNENWKEKLSNDKIGQWYHLPGTLYSHTFQNTLKVNPKAEVAYMPMVKVDGFQGFVPMKQVIDLQFIINKKAEGKLPDIMKLIDYGYADYEFLRFGLEGHHHKVVDGKKVVIPRSEHLLNSENRLGLEGFPITAEEKMQDLEDSFDPDQYKIVAPIVDQATAQGKPIAADGMPMSVYDGYEDIKTHKLYHEYMTKIIIGEWPLEKFDEFVEKWKASGGDEVTKRVNDWYNKMK